MPGRSIRFPASARMESILLRKKLKAIIAGMATIGNAENPTLERMAISTKLGRRCMNSAIAISCQDLPCSNTSSANIEMNRIAAIARMRAAQ